MSETDRRPNCVDCGDIATTLGKVHIDKDPVPLCQACAEWHAAALTPEEPNA